MSASSARDAVTPADPAQNGAPEEPSLDEQERSFVHAQVEAALAAFAGSLPETDVAWMRERLQEVFDDDPGLRALASAARPRDVDQSGEIYRDPGPPGPKKP